jgi:hypothetical protein
MKVKPSIQVTLQTHTINVTLLNKRNKLFMSKRIYLLEEKLD